MKNYYLALVLFGFICNAQVGIGTSSPNAKSVLDLTSTSKGFLPPRMNYFQKSAIVTPAAGLMVWCTDCGSTGELQVYNGTDWTNVSGATSLVSTSCGAFVAAGVWKQFLCHNLGADTSLDPHVPVQGIHGNYYQWGSSTVVANASTPAGAISGWNTTPVANGAWSDASKTANDPCPTGFRVPTLAQWDGVIANNTLSRTGSWANDGNFTTAVSWGPNSTIKSLTLPAAGFHSSNFGTLTNRGLDGDYWSSSEAGANAWALSFVSSSTWTSVNGRSYGFSVRCVSE